MSFPWSMWEASTIDALTEAQVVEHVLGELRAGRGGRIATINVDIFRAAIRDPGLKRLLAGSSLLVADGMPLVWAARLCRTPVPERVTGASLILSLSRAAAREGRSVYLLGGGPSNCRGAGPETSSAAYTPTSRWRVSRPRRTDSMPRPPKSTPCARVSPRLLRTSRSWGCIPETGAADRATGAAGAGNLVWAAARPSPLPQGRLAAHLAGCNSRAWNGCFAWLVNRAGSVAATWPTTSRLPGSCWRHLSRVGRAGEATEGPAVDGEEDVLSALEPEEPDIG